MKTRKKLLIALLSATCLTAGAFGITACSKNSETNDKALVGIYNSYVDEANGKNEEPLSYEAWLKKVFGTVGQKGEDGEDGKDGKSAYEIYRDAEYKANRTPLSETAWLASLVGTAGVSPSIGENGNWYLGTSDTGVKAAGVDGVGVTSVTLSQDGKSLVVTFTSGDPVSVPLPDQITHKHTYGNEYTVVIPSTGETEGIGYKVCTGDGCEHIELVTIASYSYKISVYMSDIMGNNDNDMPSVAANAKVTLKNDKGETVAEATTDDKGEAIFEGIEKGEYKIVVEKEGYVSFADVSDMAEDLGIVGVTAKNASDYYAMLLVAPTAGEGTLESPYQVTTSFDSEMVYLKRAAYKLNVALTYTAPKAGIYQFTNSRQKSMNPLPNGAAEEVLYVPLNEGEEFSFLVDLGIESQSAYPDIILNVVYEEAELGTQQLPVKVGLTDDVTFSAEADKDVYFCLTRKTGDATKVKITFEAENVTVYGEDGTPLSSEDIIDFGSNYNYTYSLTASAEDGNIAFKTEAYYADGEKAKPITLEGVGSYEFKADPNAIYNTAKWYKLVVAADTTYLFEQTSGYLHFSVYSDLNSEEADFETSDSTFGYEFKAGTYYINISSDADGAFEIKAFNPETDTGLVPAYPITAGAENTPVEGLRYYKYTAANAGYVVISASGINLIVYKDAAFNEVDFYSYQNKPIAVAAGDVVYFTCYGTVGDTFSIENIAADAQVAYTVTVTDTVTGNKVQGVKVKLMDGENVAGEGTTDENGVATLNAAAGSYTVVVELTDAQKELYVLSTNSDDGVSLVNKNANVSLISYVDYEVTVEGLDLLGDDAENVTVVLYSGMRSYTDISWSPKGTSAITDGKATFKVLPTAQYYKFGLAGLPEGYAAEDAMVANGTASYTLTVTEAGGDEDNGDLGTLGIGEKEFNVTERKTYTFTASSNTGEIYITVTGGYIEYLKSNNEVCINDGNEDSTSYSNDYTFGSEKYILTIVPTDEENGATVTIETVSY